MNPNKKAIITVLVSAVIIILVVVGIFKEKERQALESSSLSASAEIDEIDDYEEVDAEEEVEAVEPTPQEKMFQNVADLIDEGLAFDTGSYVKGDIPKGEYAFISFEGSGEYYSEEDAAGNIIDNENFSSFGYVYVHEAGNLETNGALVKVEALEKLGVSGAKELYEILNDKESYNESGWYKIGVDLDPGKYVIESFGEGYVAVMSGPVGNNEIINNENFNGRYSVSVKEGQYLVISRGTISN